MYFHIWEYSKLFINHSRSQFGSRWSFGELKSSRYIHITFGDGQQKKGELGHPVGSDRALSKLTVEPRGGKRDLIFLLPCTAIILAHLIIGEPFRHCTFIGKGGWREDKRRGRSKRVGVERDESMTRWIRQPVGQEINRSTSCGLSPSWQASCQRVILSSHVIPMFPPPLLDGRLLRITLWQDAWPIIRVGREGTKGEYSAREQ